MTYKLFCVVNAIGIPYNDTFRASEEMSWVVHSWRDCPKDGDHANSAKISTLETHKDELRTRGDRVVAAHIETNETVQAKIET